jgi:hypothetical protein
MQSQMGIHQLRYLCKPSRSEQVSEGRVKYHATGFAVDMGSDNAGSFGGVWLHAEIQTNGKPQPNSKQPGEPCRNHKSPEEITLFALDLGTDCVSLIGSEVESAT